MTWTGCAPGPTPATGTPPTGWPGCWQRGDLDGLRARADAGDGAPPGGWPICWPARRPGRGRTGLRARADAGDGAAARRLAELLAERGDWTWQRVCAPGPTPATSRRRAAGRAAGRARRPGRAARPGRRRRQARCRRLAGLLERGDLDELRARADAGDGLAAVALASCWPSAATWTGQLRARADAGDESAAGRLADLLAERGDLDGLRARADAGDGLPPGSWPTC